MSSTIKPRFSGVARTAPIAAALLVAAANAGTAAAATVTVTSTCTFAKAVGTINAAANQSPCTHTGTFGSSDTVVVPVGTFDIASTVNVTRSMTIHGGGKTTAYLQTTNASLQYAIHVTNPSIVVKIDNLTLTAAFANATVGISVEGANDTNLSDNNLELNYVVISSFGNTGSSGGGGLWIKGARVLMQNTLVYLNAGLFGGGVSMSIAQNSNNTTAVPTFIAKYSAISINTASVQGGGIYSNGGKLELRSSLMQQNQAPRGGAIDIDASFAPSVSCNARRDLSTAAPSEFDDNVGTQTGIGESIYTGSTTCTFNDSIGSGNTSPYCSASAVNCPQ